MTKVFTLAPGEGWIVDRFVKEWSEDNADIATNDPFSADVIWLLSDWSWQKLPLALLRSKRVITTVHHIVPEKFGFRERADFDSRDVVTDVYHVYNQRTLDFIRPMTQKPIGLVPYWANNKIWRPTKPPADIRRAHKLPMDSYIIASFQRDTEGASISSGSFKPKLEKGPDLFCDYVIAADELSRANRLQQVHVLLAGWRRQYVIERLKNANINFTYRELPDQETLNELYQCVDLYPVTARCEGGPQALIECGLLGVPVISTPVGIAEQVLPTSAIAEASCLNTATPAIPNVESWKLPQGYESYRKLLLVDL